MRKPGYGRGRNDWRLLEGAMNGIRKMVPGESANGRKCWLICDKEDGGRGKARMGAELCQLIERERVGEAHGTGKMGGRA